jgi:hypothetical protein
VPTSALTDETDLGPDVMPTVDVFGANVALPGYLGTRGQIEDELDAIAAVVRSFHRHQPDMVMRMCAAYSARLTELEVLLHRIETIDRTYRQIRTMQVDRFLQELDRQFKVASRLIEVQRQDLDMVRGAGA